MRRLERLKERPDGQPDVGETFEYEFASQFNNTVVTHLVTGWERMELDDGREVISVRCWPIHSVERRICAVGMCDMGHSHPVLSGEPAKPGAPKVWGSCGKDDDPRLVGLDYDPNADAPTVFSFPKL